MNIKFTRMIATVLVFILCVSSSGIALAAESDLSKLVLSKNELTLELGDSAALAATAVYSDGATINVTVSTTWSSDNTNIATVYNGTITAKGEGSAIVMAIYKGVPQSVQVNVTKKVKALTKNKQSVDLRGGETADIVVTATYSDNKAEDVSNKADWTSSNQKVATVVNGTITGQSSGTTTVQATFGKQTISVDVNVEVVKRIEPSKTQVSLLLKGTEKLQLIATYPDGTTKNVADEAEWSSSNERVADVIKGVITAYGSGTATITAEYGTKTAMIDVDVDKTRKLSFDEQSVFMRVNTTKQLHLTAVYPDGTNSDITNSAKWSSSNEKIADVYKGLISANTSGSVTITAQYGDKTIEIAVDVEVVRYLDVSAEEIGMSVNQSKSLTLTATYADGTKEEVQNKATWNSSNDNVTVSKGQITAYKMGEAKISASYGGKTATVTVSIDVPKKLTLSSKSVNVQVGENSQVNAIASYADGRNDEVVTDKAEWSTSNEDIAEVEKGQITGISTGSATITAKYNNKSLSLTVDVGYTSKLEADVRQMAMSAKDTQQIKLTASDSSGNKKDVSADAEWKSSNPSVADVISGLVTAYSSGKTTITAKYGNQTVTISVEVDIIDKIEASKLFLFMKSGDKTKITITVTYSDGTTKDVTTAAEWKTSNYKVVAVDKGNVTAVAYGKTNVSAKYKGKSISIPVDVDTLKYLQTDEVSLNMKVGQQVQVTATATYSDESEGDVSKPAVWSSSKILTATVKNGLIKATGKGKATITVKFAGKQTKVIVTVQ